MRSGSKTTTKPPKGLKFLTNKTIPHLGDVEVWRKESTQTQILKKKITLETTSESDFDALKRLASMKHNNIIGINEIKKVTEKEYDVFFEDVIDHDLLEEARHRLERERRFSDREALEILQQIASAIGYLHKNDTYHGEITINTIYRDSNGKYQLLHPLFTIASNTKRLTEKKKKAQLAQSYKRDVENLGKTLLEAYFFPEPIHFPLKNPTEILKDRSLSTILEILLKLANGQEKDTPDIFALEKVLNSKETQEKVERDDLEAKNKPIQKPLVSYSHVFWFS